MPFSNYSTISPLVALFILAGCTTSKSSPPAPQSVRPESATFKSPVFADLEQFHRSVFLIDNASMLNTLATLKDELQKSVNSLSQEQSFNIGFLLGSEWFGPEPVQATAAAKKKCTVFLESITTGGTTDPMCCLDEAFSQKPDVIYLLSDGYFPDNQALLKKIRELDKDRKVKVYTIAYMDGTMVDADFVDLMKTIAAETGGKFRRVDGQAAAGAESAADKPPAKSAPAGEAPEAKKPASMFDDLDGADRLLFLCDVGGSMIGKVALLMDQLEKALPVLTPHQLFGIIFFQDTKSDMRNEKLLPATPENLRKAESRFEGFSPLGPMNPIPGIEAAFKLEPQVIYLVTDGDFPDNEAVLKMIRKLDKDKKVKVYTIAFVGKDDTDTDFITLLKTIAEETGGKYKRVNLDDL